MDLQEGRGLAQGSRLASPGAPGLERKWEKNVVNTLTLALSQSISTGKSDINTEAISHCGHMYIYIYTHLEQACPP